MPIGNANNNNFTFNRSTTVDIGVGYHSRVIFSFVPYNFAINLADYDEWSANLYQNILEPLKTFNPEFCHGDYILPRAYIKSGKSFRVRGTFLCTHGAGGRVLNLWFGIGNGTTNYVLGAQDNNTVNFSLPNGASNLPVDFELNICNAYSDQFYGHGYYHWNQDNYNAAGDNNDDRYMPVWNGTAISTSTLDPASTYAEIWFNGYGSTLETVLLTNLVIEEIA